MPFKNTVHAGGLKLLENTQKFNEFFLSVVLSKQNLAQSSYSPQNRRSLNGHNPENRPLFRAFLRPSLLQETIGVVYRAQLSGTAHLQ